MGTNHGRLPLWAHPVDRSWGPANGTHPWGGTRGIHREDLPLGPSMETDHCERRRRLALGGLPRGPNEEAYARGLIWVRKSGDHNGCLPWCLLHICNAMRSHP